MENNTAVMDLTVACVTSVKNASGMELDLSQDTLPILDHYARLLDAPRDEMVSLMAPMSGARRQTRIMPTSSAKWSRTRSLR